MGCNLRRNGELAYANSIEGAGTRTLDLRIKSPLLYQLSYAFLPVGHVPTKRVRYCCEFRPFRKSD